MSCARMSWRTSTHPNGGRTHSHACTSPCALYSKRSREACSPLPTIGRRMVDTGWQRTYQPAASSIAPTSCSGQQRDQHHDCSELPRQTARVSVLRPDLGLMRPGAFVAVWRALCIQHLCYEVSSGTAAVQGHHNTVRCSDCAQDFARQLKAAIEVFLAAPEKKYHASWQCNTACLLALQDPAGAHRVSTTQLQGAGTRYEAHRVRIHPSVAVSRCRRNPGVL
jgi:hypothetical protein